MQFSIFGIQPDGLLVCLHGWFQLALLSQGAGKVGVGDRIVWIEFDHFTILRDRHLQTSLLLISHAEIRSGRCKCGIQPDGFLVFLDRHLWMVGPFMDLRQEIMRMSRFWIGFRRRLIGLDGLLRLSRLGQEQSHKEMCMRLLGMTLADCLDPGFDLFDVLGFLQRLSM